MRPESRSLSDWLDDLLVNAEKIVVYTASVGFAEFMASEPLRDLVIRKLENMGEAARYIRELYPEFYEEAPLPWRDIRRMRNRLSHGYFDVTEAVLWQTAREDVPALLDELRPLIAAHRPGGGG